MRRTIFGILIAGMAVAACGSSAGSGAPGVASGPAGASASSAASQITLGNVPDPCKMLSKAEVEAAVGHTVADGVPDIVNSCKWDSTPGSVSLHFLAIGAATCAAASANRTPIPGLAVPASWHFIPAGTTGSVVACTKGLQVQVTIVGDIVKKTPPEATISQQAVQLIGLVLGRIERLVARMGRGAQWWPRPRVARASQQIGERQCRRRINRATRSLW